MDIGPVIMVIALLLMPVLILMTGAIAAGLLGALVGRDVEEQHEGSELAELWG